MPTSEEQQQVLGDAVRLSQDISSMVRREMEAVVGQLIGEGKRAGLGVGLLSGGAALGYASLLVGLGAATELLSMVMPRWLAATVVSGAAAGLAVSLAQRGRSELEIAGTRLALMAESAAQDQQATSAR